MPTHTVEAAKPAWFVVNMCERWSDSKLDRSTKPQLLFHSLADAYAYATEMANQHSRGDYAVFECVGRLVSNPTNPPGKPGLKRAPAKIKTKDAIVQGQSRTCGESGASLAQLPFV